MRQLRAAPSERRRDRRDALRRRRQRCEARDGTANTPHLEIKKDANGRRAVVHDIVHKILEANRHERPPFRI